MNNQRRSRHEHKPRLDAGADLTQRPGRRLRRPPDTAAEQWPWGRHDGRNTSYRAAKTRIWLWARFRWWEQAGRIRKRLSPSWRATGDAFRWFHPGGGGGISDLRAGLLSLTWRQIKALRRMSSAYDRAIGVGDVYPLALNAFFLKRPFVFIPTAKSDYIRPHYGVEIALMRRTCAAVFPRDAKTAAGLAQKGVPAQYLGNLMMDALRITGVDYRAGAQWVIGILPGSRAPEAYRNTAQLLRVVEWIHELANSDMPCCLSL